MTKEEIKTIKAEKDKTVKSNKIVKK